MSNFPSLAPAIRTWTPASYANTSNVSISGRFRSVRLSNNAQQSVLRLGFEALTESEMLLIYNHYTNQLGSFLPFYLPDSIWSAATNPGSAWRYNEPPQVEDIAADGQTRYSVSLQLLSVAAEMVDDYFSGLHSQVFNWDVGIEVDSWGS